MIHVIKRTRTSQFSLSRHSMRASFVYNKQCRFPLSSSLTSRNVVFHCHFSSLLTSKNKVMSQAWLFHVSASNYSAQIVYPS